MYTQSKNYSISIGSFQLKNVAHDKCIYSDVRIARCGRDSRVGGSRPDAWARWSLAKHCGHEVPWIDMSTRGLRITIRHMKSDQILPSGDTSLFNSYQFSLSELEAVKFWQRPFILSLPIVKRPRASYSWVDRQIWIFENTTLHGFCRFQWEWRCDRAVRFVEVRSDRKKG